MLCGAADGWEAFEKLKRVPPSRSIADVPAEELVQPPRLPAGATTEGVPPPSPQYKKGKKVNGVRPGTPANGRDTRAVRGLLTLSVCEAVLRWMSVDCGSIGRVAVVVLCLRVQ